MASLRTIKRRIKSVKSTQQITNAMSLVSAAKLQRAKSKLIITRPFFEETRRVIKSITANAKGLRNPFFAAREPKRAAVVVLSSDRGLCGGHNIIVCKEAMTLLNDRPNAALFVVGSKGRDYFRRRRKRIESNYTGISERPMYEDAELVGSALTDLFINGHIDEVFLVYTKFLTTISHEPQIVKLLPLDFRERDEAEPESDASVLMSYEPSEDETLDYIIPRYINTVIYGAMVESAACEQGARIKSMDSATKNAGSMITKKTIAYNRARQGAITQELIEIVSGANSLA